MTRHILDRERHEGEAGSARIWQMTCDEQASARRAEHFLRQPRSEAPAKKVQEFLRIERGFTV